MRKIDEVGNVHGRLTVVKRAGAKWGQVLWLCKCECGNETVVPGHNLRKGNTRSCGCIQKEMRRDSGMYPKMDKKHRKTYGQVAWRLVNYYNITEDIYRDYITSNKGCCPICKESLDWSGIPHVDHDHETGEFRGVLCGQCNVGLGSFRDNVTSLENAKQYLKKNIIR